MKITSLKQTVGLLVTAAALLCGSPAKAQSLTLGQVLGAVWKVGNAITGETTLTPAYAISSYQLRQIQRGLGFRDYDTTRKVERDLLGQYFYYSKLVVPGLGTPVTNSAVFPVSSMNKLNMTCTNLLGGTLPVTNITVETHTETVWMASVVSTGLLNDSGPWTVWLKTAGYKYNCSRPAPPSPLNYYYWVPAKLSQSGSQLVSLGTPNAILSYPFYLAHDFYK